MTRTADQAFDRVVVASDCRRRSDKPSARMVRVSSRRRNGRAVRSGRRCPSVVGPPECGGRYRCPRVPGQQRRCCLSRCTPKSPPDLRTHRDGRRTRSPRRASALAPFTHLPECLLAIDRLRSTDLEIVVAAVERFANRCLLFQTPCKGILDDLFGARPLVVARSVSFLAVSGVTCTSMPLLCGFGDRPASTQAARRRLSLGMSQLAI
jgi:hypothetical protein